MPAILDELLKCTNSNSTDLTNYSDKSIDEHNYYHRLNPLFLNDHSSMPYVFVRDGVLGLFSFIIDNPLYKNKDSIHIFPEIFKFFIPSTWDIKYLFYKPTNTAIAKCSINNTKDSVLIYANSNETNFKIFKENLSLLNEYQNTVNNIYICFKSSIDPHSWNQSNEDKIIFETYQEVILRFPEAKFISLHEMRTQVDFSNYLYLNLGYQNLLLYDNYIDHLISSRGAYNIKTQTKNDHIQNIGRFSPYHGVHLFEEKSQPFKINELMYFAKSLKNKKNHAKTFLIEYSHDLLDSYNLLR